MKSVVVEASTVAKAIETAWHKADKPEEFFIRILQEHQSGFLGFGAQKAKIVFFFKNSQKTDSLFPVVLKQKEYANLFGNQTLKVPTEVNIIDTQLNKNVSLGGQKKKHHHQQQNNQNQQLKNKKNVQSAEQSLDVQKVVHKQNQQHKNKPEQQKIVHANKNHDVVTQIKIQTKPVQLQHQKVVAKTTEFVDEDALHSKKNHDAVHKKNSEHKQVVEQQKFGEHKQKLQITLQVPVGVEPQDRLIFVDKKEDVVQDIARALKKVQSQKIVANVSRQMSTKNQDLHKKIMNQPVDKKSVEISDAKTEQVTETKKTVLKFKRRPLIVDDQVASGIKPRLVKSNSSDEKKTSHLSYTIDSKKDL